MLPSWIKSETAGRGSCISSQLNDQAEVLPTNSLCLTGLLLVGDDRLQRTQLIARCDIALTRVRCGRCTCFCAAIVSKPFF
jgi:hypothetical protein